MNIFYAKLRNKIITYCYITFNLIKCNWTRQKVIYMHYFTISSDIYEASNVFLFESLYKKENFCKILIRVNKNIPTKVFFIPEKWFTKWKNQCDSPNLSSTVVCSCHYDFLMKEVPCILVEFTLLHNYFVLYDINI